jgi:hypothetical protein
LVPNRYEAVNIRASASSAMWNSNSLIAWLVAGTGLDSDSIRPPVGGRAPGWNAGLVVARPDR